MSVKDSILNNKTLKNLVPAELKAWLKSRMDTTDYDRSEWAKNNPFVGTPYEWSFQGKTDYKVGIFYDPAHYHRYYQMGCYDLGVSYVVIDLMADNWVEIVRNSGCSMFFIWPHINSNVLKEAYDERIRLISEDMGLPIYPDEKGLFLLDNKRRVRDWLQVNNFPLPDTWCFFYKEEALDFAEHTSYPIIFKTLHGSVSRGVKILKTKQEAIALINQCFGEGVVPYRMDSRNRQWGVILFQEYLPDVDERRMIRIGDSYLAIDKVRNKTEFHSGSGIMRWADPGDYFLNLTKEIAERGNFRSINVDFFLSKDGRILVNELHPVFHGPKIPDDERTGRYVQNNGKWEFQPGNFYRNYCGNLRVLDALQQVGLEVPDNKTWLKKDVFQFAL